MKKLLLTMLGVVGMLCSTSCSDEEIVSGVEGETMVQFTVELTDGSDASRAISDGLSVDDLYCEVYSIVNNTPRYLAHLDKDAVEMTKGTNAKGETVMTAKVDFALVKGQSYKVVFWAQDENGAYTIAENENGKLTNITLNPTTANNEANDAFTAVKELTVTGPISETITLTRPFAQINFGTLDVEAAKNAGITFSESRIIVSNAVSSYNALMEEAASEGAELTFEWASNVENIANETLEVGGTPYKYLATAYMLVPGDKTQKLSGLTMEIRTGLNEIITLNVPNAPVQRNYRTNILGNLLTNTADFIVEVSPIYDGDKVIMEKDVNNNEDLEAALRQNEEHIVINLGDMGRSEKSEYVVNVGAWQEQYYFGGEKTKTITINGNGHKINFKHNNNDWNYIRCKNEATKWIINDVELTNSGANNGPWNRHDIRFYNAVELNEITSDKAIAVLNDAILNKVNITEDIEAYALWITAEGQTVTVKNSNITALNKGRGIAIKDEYVDSPAKVNLSVENTTFKTAKKAAILVTSTVGADIKLSNNDISAVEADGLNAVWVDEEYADYADLVTVEGGFKKVEGSAESVTSIENATVNIPVGVYTMPKNIANGVSLIGADGATFKVGGNSITADNVTIKNFAIVNDGVNKTPISLSGKNPTIEDCVFTGAAGNGFGLVVSGKSEDNVITVKNCDFSQDDFFKPIFDGWNGLGGGTLVIDGCKLANGLYAMHIDANKQSGKVVVKNSLVAGFVTNGASLESISFENCEFGEASGYACANLYTSHSFVNCTFPTKAAANNVGNYGLYVASNAKGDAMVMNNCKMSDGTELNMYNMAVVNGGFLHWDSDAKACDWTVNGVKYGEDIVEETDGLFKDVETGEYKANSSTGLDYALNKGYDVTLVNDVTADADVTEAQSGYGKTGLAIDGSVFDGGNNTVTVKNANSTWDSAILAKSGTIKNMTINGAFRGIFMGGATGDVIIDNVVIDKVCYTFNSDDGDKEYGVYISNSTINGWTSYSDVHKEVVFTDCTFGKGTGGYQYAFCRPYAPSVFENCEFEAGFEFDTSKQANIVFKNCTYGGVKITAENAASLKTGDVTFFFNGVGSVTFK